jgi:uncharacterized protein YdaT
MINREKIIERMVEEWIDGAEFDTIVDYAAEKLHEWYTNLNDEELEELREYDQ